MPDESMPLWEVTAADPATGSEQQVQVSAPTIDQARERIAATGMIVGLVRLLSIDSGATPPTTAKAQPAQRAPSNGDAAPAGATVCPSCGGWRWVWYRPLGVAVAIALLFPLGLLALLTRRRYICTSCGFELPCTMGEPQHLEHAEADSTHTSAAIAVGLLLWLGSWVVLESINV